MKGMAIERPDGSFYRPRRLRSQVLGNEDETTGIVVFGTHDVAQAASIARLDITALNREYGLDPEDEQNILDEGSARRVWWTQKLSHFEDDEPRYYYVPDEESGWAGVEFEVTWDQPEPGDAVVPGGWPNPEPMFDAPELPEPCDVCGRRHPGQGTPGVCDR